jgi:phosphoribosyl 1,2-cyclic phosphodiesterase
MKGKKMDSTSNLVFWGVRGTCPVSGKDRNKYGGHTPCASLEVANGEVLIVDAGTGIRGLGESLLREKKGQPLRLHLFFTHFHLDHIQGIPFFAPLYSAETSLAVYSDAAAEETEKQLSFLMGGRFFPVPFRETASRKKFAQVPREGLKIGDCRISFCPLHHPQGSVAYKIETGAETIVMATDTEHPERGVDEKLAEFSSGSDVLVYDATFTPAEYESGKSGWGHSTWLEGTKLAEEAGVENLCLSHFNPDHSDVLIDEIVSSIRLDHKK